jgi:cystathionine gamma-lyase
LFPAAHEYSRSSNPTREGFELAVAACEAAKHAIAFSSGSATLAAVADLLVPGDHIVVYPANAYGGTTRYLTRVVAARGVSTSFVPIADSLESALQGNTRLLWLETPSNPILSVIDIVAVVAMARQRSPRVLIAVDNTCLSPFFQRPLSLGVDIVVHSASKYLNGHSDAVLGVVLVDSDALHEQLRFLQNAAGAIPAPLECYLAHRGLKTLPLRMTRHAANALRLAQFLEAHPGVERVSYPGLASHPQHAIAARQQRGFGGMLAFWLRSDLEGARRFLNALRGPCTLAESMGGLETLVKHPAIMTHAHMSATERAKLGLADTLVRVSVGLEDIEDIIEDISRGLDAVGANQATTNEIPK